MQTQTLENAPQSSPSTTLAEEHILPAQPAQTHGIGLAGNAHCISEGHLQTLR